MLAENPLAGSNWRRQAFVESFGEQGNFQNQLSLTLEDTIELGLSKAMSELALYETLTFRNPLWTARIMGGPPGLGTQPS